MSERESAIRETDTGCCNVQSLSPSRLIQTITPSLSSTEREALLRLCALWRGTYQMLTCNDRPGPETQNAGFCLKAIPREKSLSDQIPDPRPYWITRARHP